MCVCVEGGGGGGRMSLILMEYIVSALNYLYGMFVFVYVNIIRKRGGEGILLFTNFLLLLQNVFSGQIIKTFKSIANECKILLRIDSVCLISW